MGLYTSIDYLGQARTIPLFVMEWLIVLVGVLGNILVIILIAFYDGIRKPVNKILFINLAIADLGFLLLRHPFKFIKQLYGGSADKLHGVFTCQFLEPISMAFIPASLLIIIAISYYRHQGIVQLGRSELSVRKASFIIGAIWIFTLAFYPIRRIPISKFNETSVCQQKEPEVVSNAIRLAEIALFLSVVLGTFILFLRMRRTLINSSKFHSSLRISLRINQNAKTLRVLKPVIIVLFLTISPISALDAFRILAPNPQPVIPFRDYLMLHHIFVILMLVNSSGNPFIYAFASREFRVSFQRLLRLRWTRNHRVNPPSESSHKTG